MKRCIVLMDEGFFTSLLTKGEKLDGEVVEGLPPGCSLVRVSMDVKFDSGQVALMFEGDGLPETEPGCAIPTVHALFCRSEHMPGGVMYANDPEGIIHTNHCECRRCEAARAEKSAEAPCLHEDVPANLSGPCHKCGLFVLRMKTADAPAIVQENSK